MANVQRTAAIQAAIVQQLNARRAMLDAADDLGEITIEIRLHPGTANVKAIVVSELHVNRRTL